MYFYHVTTKDKTTAIMHDGLIPKIGENATLVHEQDPAVYLCEHKDIGIWSILLNTDVVFRVTYPSEKLKKYNNYDGYAEYVSYEHISPDNIKRIYGKKPTREQMRKLCISYIYSISTLCKNTARYYYNTQHEADAEIELSAIYEATLLCLKHLDYSVLTMTEIKKILKNAGESGEYTLCDMYLDTNNKLYQQLINYPNDKLTEVRTRLYNYIIKNFKKSLNIKTGGWTG